MPGTLVNPSSARLISDWATYGAATTCGNSALNCSQRCPRAERTSALESSSPRFCFSPRSMASCSESGITSGTSLAGTLLENGLTPSVPGMAWPGLLVVSVCARDAAAPQDKIAASRKLRANPQRKVKEASPGREVLVRRCRGGQHPSPPFYFGQPLSAAGQSQAPECERQTMATKVNVRPVSRAAS